MRFFPEKVEENSKLPEVDLWRAVLDRALRDLFVNERTCGVDEQRRALAWVYDGGIDFQTVCLFAGRNPGLLRFKILELLYVRKLIRQKRLTVAEPRTLIGEIVLLSSLRNRWTAHCSPEKWVQQVEKLRFEEALKLCGSRTLKDEEAV